MPSLKAIGHGAWQPRQSAVAYHVHRHAPVGAWVMINAHWYKELSSIQQGIRQADPSLADQQRKLRGYVYSAQNDEVAFQKAAKAIAR